MAFSRRREGAFTREPLSFKSQRSQFLMIYWKRFLCLPVALNLSVVLTSPYLQTCWPLVLRNVVIHHLSYALTVWSRELHCLYKPVSVNQASFVSKLIQLPEFCQCVSMPKVCVSSAQCSWNRLRCGDTKDWAFDLTCKPNFHLYEITQCCQCSLSARSNH